MKFFEDLLFLKKVGKFNKPCPWTLEEGRIYLFIPAIHKVWIEHFGKEYLNGELITPRMIRSALKAEPGFYSNQYQKYFNGELWYCTVFFFSLSPDSLIELVDEYHVDAPWPGFGEKHA
jgi:hypothetical protein